MAVTFRTPSFATIRRFDRGDVDLQNQIVRAARAQVAIPGERPFGPIYYLAADHACVDFVNGGLDSSILDAAVASVDTRRRASYRDALDAMGPTLASLKPVSARRGGVMNYRGVGGGTLVRARVHFVLSLDGISEQFCWVHWSKVRLDDITRQLASEVVAGVAAQSSGLIEAKAMVIEARQPGSGRLVQIDKDGSQPNRVARAATLFRSRWEDMDPKD